MGRPLVEKPQGTESAGNPRALIPRTRRVVASLTSSSMPASTNHQLAPTLRAQVPDTLVPEGVGGFLDAVVDDAA